MRPLSYCLLLPSRHCFIRTNFPQKHKQLPVKYSIYYYYSMAYISMLPSMLTLAIYPLASYGTTWYLIYFISTFPYSPPIYLSGTGGMLFTAPGGACCWAACCWAASCACHTLLAALRFLSSVIVMAQSFMKSNASPSMRWKSSK